MITFCHLSHYYICAYETCVVEDSILLESVFIISIWGKEKFKRSALALFPVIAIAAAMAKAPNM